MIRITVELLPFGSDEHKRLLGVAEISNDATGTKQTGNYRYSLSKWDDPKSIWKLGEIKSFPRLSRGAWDLLFLVLKHAVGDRND